MLTRKDAERALHNNGIIMRIKKLSIALIMTLGLLVEPTLTHAAESTATVSEAQPSERRPAGNNGGSSGSGSSSSGTGRRPSSSYTPGGSRNYSQPPRQSSSEGRRPTGNRSEPSSRSYNNSRSYSSPPHHEGATYYAPAPSRRRGHRPPPPPYYGGTYIYGGTTYYSDYPTTIGYYADYGSSRLDNYIGLRVGVNAASVHSEAAELDGSSMKAGLNIGLIYGQQILPTVPLYFETGLFYSQKGGKSKYSGYSASSGRTEFTYNLDYLEVPLVLKYIHWANPRSRISIEPYFGGFIGLGVAGKIKDYGERQAFSSYENNYFKRFDGGLKVGCGVGFGLGYFDVSYDIGLANVGQDIFDDTRTGCLTINLGVNF